MHDISPPPGELASPVDALSPIGIQQIQAAYDQLAATYDENYRTPMHLAENDCVFAWVRREMARGAKPPGEQRVLEIACGTGLLLEGVPIAPERYTGIDLSHDMLERARAKFPRHDFRESDMHDMWQLPDGGYDFVCCIFGGFAYALFPRVAAREIHRVLAPGGRYAVMPYSPHYPTRPSYIINQHRWELPNTLLSPQSWRLHFRTTGFIDNRVQGFHASVERLTLGTRTPRSLLRRLLDLEARTLGRSRPDLFYYFWLTGRRPGGGGGAGHA